MENNKFDPKKLGSVAQETFELLMLDMIPSTLPCAVCGKGWSRNDFLLAIDRYDHPSLAEVLISGTHPECWDKMFGDGDIEE